MINTLIRDPHITAPPRFAIPYRKPWSNLQTLTGQCAHLLHEREIKDKRQRCDCGQATQTEPHRKPLRSSALLRWRRKRQRPRGLSLEALSEPPEPPASALGFLKNAQRPSITSFPAFTSQRFPQRYPEAKICAGYNRICKCDL